MKQVIEIHRDGSDPYFEKKILRGVDLLKTLE